MILYVFTIRDRATDQFGNPHFMLNSGQAIRSFTDEVNRNDKDSMIYKHPDDFDLYSLGSYDSDTGLFTTGSPEQVCIGKQVKIRE